MSIDRTPNIFSFGTSELTQDAFIAWLISYADPKYNDVDAKLHKVGVEFLSKIFELNKIKLPFIETLEVQTQKNNMDVYVKLNDEYHIIIEDKVYSITSSKQLERYVENLNKHEKIDRSKIIPVFFKTRDQSRSLFEKNNYMIIDRKYVLNLLEKGVAEGVQNDLFKQYYNYLAAIEERVEAFREQNPIDWEHPQWRGFFKYLFKELEEGDWSYVSNKKGGFMGFWWNGNTVKKNHLYLQIEKDKLCFKIRNIEGEKVSRDDKWHWLECVRNVAKKMSIPVNKPKRMGHGKHVTFAVWKLEEDHWIPRNDDGSPDLKLTVKRLQSAANLLNKTVQNLDTTPVL